MKLWSWLRNHDKLNTLEDELHGLSEALKVANFEVDSLIDLHNEQSKLVEKLAGELLQLKAQKIQLTETMRVSMTGATVSLGPVSEEEHVSIQDLSKTLSTEHVYTH